MYGTFLNYFMNSFHTYCQTHRNKFYWIFTYTFLCFVFIKYLTVLLLWKTWIPIIWFYPIFDRRGTKVTLVIAREVKKEMHIVVCMRGENILVIFYCGLVTVRNIHPYITGWDHQICCRRQSSLYLILYLCQSD